MLFNMDIFIYKITNPKGAVYVGKTKDLLKRFRQYIKYPKLITQPKLQYSIMKYGWDFHTKEILEVCSEENSNERERFWIKKLNCYYHDNKSGLNLTKGGDGGSGRIKNKSGKKVKQVCFKTKNIVKVWDSVNEAATHLNVSRNSIYAAIQGRKQVVCKGYLWAYEGEDIKYRDYLTKDRFKIEQRAEKLRLKYKNREIVNPQQGKTGILNLRSKQVKCIELDKEFGSIRLAAIYLKNNNLIDKNISAICENISTSAKANGEIIGNGRLYNFIYV
jgi:hypothetical protein